MSDKLIYPWDAETKLALPPRVPQLDQRASKKAGRPAYMPCACSTDEAPPVADNGCAVCRKDGAWVQVEHHRGKTIYDMATCAERKVGDTEVGVPEGMTMKKPGPVDKWDERSDGWKEDLELKAEIDKQATRAKAVQEAEARIISNSPDIAIVLGLIDPAQGA